MKFLGGDLGRWLWGCGTLLSFPEMALGRGVTTALPYHLVIVLKCWVGSTLKKGWHPPTYTPEAGTTARSAVQKSLSAWPVTWSKIHTTVLCPVGPENPMRMNKCHLRV